MIAVQLCVALAQPFAALAQLPTPPAAFGIAVALAAAVVLAGIAAAPRRQRRNPPAPGRRLRHMPA